VNAGCFVSVETPQAFAAYALRQATYEDSNGLAMAASCPAKGFTSAQV
jgi:hypothetical protein